MCECLAGRCCCARIRYVSRNAWTLECARTRRRERTPAGARGRPPV
nr:MAG: hypothetical protein [Molluscum contagiosum virus]